MKNVFTIKVTLRLFELVSSLRVNFYKSSFGAIEEDKTTVEKYASMLNCKILTLQFSYQGLPIGANRRKVEMWHPIIRKFEKRLALWKHKHIYFVGWVCLINLVLSSLPLFFLSFFKIPKEVCSKLVGIQRRILWGGDDVNNKIAWVKWEDICKTKKLGGLGVKDIRVLNEAFFFGGKIEVESFS